MTSKGMRSVRPRSSKGGKPAFRPTEPQCMRSVSPGFLKGRKLAFRSTEPQGVRSVRPGFSKGRKPAFRSTETQGRKVRTPKDSPAVRSPGTKLKEPKVDASPNKGDASSIRFFIGHFKGGTTGKMVGYIPFDGDKCGFVDLPYDPRVRGLKAIEPKRKPRQYTDPSVEVGVPIEDFDSITDGITAMSRFLESKDGIDGTKAVEQ